MLMAAVYRFLRLVTGRDFFVDLFTSLKQEAQPRHLLVINDLNPSYEYLGDAMIGMTRPRLSRGLRLGQAVMVNGTSYQLLPVAPSFEETLAADDSRLFSTPGLHRSAI